MFVKQIRFPFWTFCPPCVQWFERNFQFLCPPCIIPVNGRFILRIKTGLNSQLTDNGKRIVIELRDDMLPGIQIKFCFTLFPFGLQKMGIKRDGS